jgi:hypothetical protein
MVIPRNTANPSICWRQLFSVSGRTLDHSPLRSRNLSNLYYYIRIRFECCIQVRGWKIHAGPSSKTTELCRWKERELDHGDGTAPMAMTETGIIGSG